MPSAYEAYELVGKHHVDDKFSPKGMVEGKGESSHAPITIAMAHPDLDKDKVVSSCQSEPNYGVKLAKRIRGERGTFTFVCKLS